LPIQLPSQWTWFRPKNASLRTRASAIFLKAAKARGYDSEDQWFDELRYADFVGFRIVTHGPEKLPDGTFVDIESGVLKDAVNDSITLCHQLEAGNAPKPIIGRLPSEAIARMEAATAVFMADFVPRLEREVPTLEDKPDRRVRDANLLRELVIHHFETAARECLVLFVSVGEFETELWAGIARFVHFSVGQYQWLGDAMRRELDAGFAFFVMRAKPWAGIPEADRASKWHVGAITGEALSHTALRLIAEATARAPQSDFPKANQAGATENQAPNGSTITETGPVPEGRESGCDIDSRKAARRKLRDDYKAECRNLGVKVTDGMIAEAANPPTPNNKGWQSRSNIQKWIACDSKYEGKPDQRIRNVFVKKIHLKKPQG
jgi:hypothetical protein